MLTPDNITLSAETDIVFYTRRNKRFSSIFSLQHPYDRRFVSLGSHLYFWSAITQSLSSHWTKHPQLFFQYLERYTKSFDTLVKNAWTFSMLHPDSKFVWQLYIFLQIISRLFMRWAIKDYFRILTPYPLRWWILCNLSWSLFGY